MSKELFNEFNEQANYNLGAKGNLSNVILAYANLAKAMGKEEMAAEMIASLPPAESLEHPDMRLEGIRQIYSVEKPIVEQTMTR